MREKSQSNKPLEKSLYAIEKSYQRQIKPVQKQIIDMKQSYDDILSDAQKAFETNEHHHQTQLRTLKKNHTKTLRDLNKSYDQSIQQQKDTLNNMTNNVKQTIQSVQDNHKQTLTALDKSIETARQKKTQTMQAIENKYKAQTEAFEQKIRVHEQNLEANKQALMTDIDGLLSSVYQQYEDEKARAKTIETDLEAKINSIITDIKDEQAATQDTIQKQHNAYNRHINDLRKTLNDHHKTFTRQLYKNKDALQKPLMAFNTITERIKHETANDIETFNKRLSFDVAEETNRLKYQLKQTEDKQEQTFIQKQIDLNTNREQTLNEHSQALYTLIESSTQTMQEIFQTLTKQINTDFDHHMSIVDQHVTMIKDKFDIFQQTQANRHEHLKTLGDHQHDQGYLHAIKTLLTETFKALITFEQERLFALYDTTKSLKPLYEEADDIRAFLDTKDAQKEIIIHREKIDIEKKDASLRHEMTLRQKEHEKTINDIETKQTLKTTECLHKIDKEKETQTLKTLEAEKTSAIQKKTLTFEKETAALTYDLRKKHAHTDEKQLKKRQTLDIRILEKELTLKGLEQEKALALQQAEQADDTKQQIRRIELMISDKERQISRLNDHIEQIESREAQALKRSLESLRATHKQETNALTQSIEAEKEHHQERLAFIEQAFKRESEQAISNLDEVNRLIKARLNPLKASYQQQRQTIKDTQARLQTTTDDLKTLLPPLTRGFKESLLYFIDACQQALEVTYDHIYTEKKQTLEQQGHPRAQTQKLTAQQQKQLDTLKQKSNAIKTTIEAKQAKPYQLLKRKETLQFNTLKTHIETMLKDITTIIKKHYEETSTQIEALFEPFTTSDQKKLDKATYSKKQAIEKETERHQAALKPLEAEQTQLHLTQEKALQDHKQTHKQKQKQAIEPLLIDRENIKHEADKLYDQKDTYQDTLDQLDATFAANNQTEQTNLQNTKAKKIESIKTYYASRINIIHERLEDAEKLYTFTLNHVQKSIEDIEQSLQEKHEEADKHYQYVYDREQRDINLIKERTNAALEEEKASLTKDTDDYETQILSSKARLETDIDKALRSLNDTVRLKTTRLDALNKTIHDKETTLYDTFSQFHDDLAKNLTEIQANFMPEQHINTQSAEQVFDDDFKQFNDYIQHIKEDITKQ